MRWAAALLFVPIVLFASPATPTLRVDGDDGKVALELSALKVRVTVRGHLARTEFELTYRNALDRIAEGEFEFPLPPDAEVSDVALWFDEGLRHAVAVERVAARTAYEEVVHWRVDPALIEWNAGRTFRLHVFPIPAKGEKKVHLAYDQELTTNDYELELRYARGFVSIDVDAEGRAVSNDDGVIRVARDIAETAFIARAEDGHWYASAAVDIDAAPTAVARAPHVVILYDTSSSAVYQDSAALRRFLESFLARQQETAVAEVIPFHVELAPPQRIDRAGTPEAALQLERVLGNLQPLGATNLLAVASDLPRIVRTLPTSTRIVLVTDGLTPLGDSREVNAAFRKLAELRRPLVLVNAAPSADATLLASTANATGGWWLDLTQLDPDVAAANAMRVPSRVQMNEGVLPRSAVSSTATRIAVAARANERMALPIAGRELSDAKAASMIRRAWAHAALRDMLARGASDQELLAHGRAFTQLTPRTSFIVLETWWQYERYGIPLPPDLVEDKARYEAERKRRDAEYATMVNKPLEPSKATPGGWWIEGRLLDPSGKAMPGIRVTLMDGGTALDAVVTDDDGGYVLGVASPPKNARIVAANGTVQAEAPFISEAITVTASAPVLYTTICYTASSISSLRTGEITTHRLLPRGEMPDRQTVIETLRGIGSTAERLRYYLAARALLGGDKGFHVFAAEIFRERSPEIAARVLSDLAEAYPDDTALLRLLARVVDGWGESDLARLLLQRALEIAPDEPQSLREMILLEARHGRGDRVESLANRMLALYDLNDWRMEEALDQTAAALARWARTGAIERARGLDLRADPQDDLTIELMFDSEWATMHLEVCEPSQPMDASFTGQPTRGGPQIYTLRDAPRGTYAPAIRYRPDNTRVSLETLVHVIVYQRGRRGRLERREHFLVLGGEDEDRALPRVTID